VRSSHAEMQIKDCYTGLLRIKKGTIMTEIKLTTKEKLELQIKKSQNKEKQLKAKLRKIAARENSQNRKDETRVKIIIGGFIYAHLKKGEVEFINLVKQAISESSDRDSRLLNKNLNSFLKEKQNEN